MIVSVGTEKIFLIKTQQPSTRRNFLRLIKACVKTLLTLLFMGKDWILELLKQEQSKRVPLVIPVTHSTRCQSQCNTAVQRNKRHID